MISLLLLSWQTHANEAMNETLIYHTYFGKAASVQQALVKGANPNTRDEHGWPVLAAAADRSGNEAYAISKALLEAGADVNAAKDRNYPILNAIKNENAPLVALMVAANANLRVRNAEGISVYSIAKKLGNSRIIYQIEKKLMEQAQTQTFLRSKQHLRQLTSQYAFHHCAFQYWGFYLRSKQDKEMDEEAIKDRMRTHANDASATGQRALQYFPNAYNAQYDKIISTQRANLAATLNKMISNRNRRRQGVGKTADMFKRCHLDKTPTYFHATAVY
ncbi:MAG: ankyrin repeat domain-containing protein [Rickettsiales bacterium]|nr:ankyrin repeat domain-containing protein [Rickettsiales bacterium]